MLHRCMHCRVACPAWLVTLPLLGRLVCHPQSKRTDPTCDGLQVPSHCRPSQLLQPAPSRCHHDCHSSFHTLTLTLNLACCVSSRRMPARGTISKSCQAAIALWVPQPLLCCNAGFSCRRVPFHRRPCGWGRQWSANFFLQWGLSVKETIRQWQERFKGAKYHVWRNSCPGVRSCMG